MATVAGATPANGTPNTPVERELSVATQPHRAGLTGRRQSSRRSPCGTSFLSTFRSNVPVWPRAVSRSVSCQLCPRCSVLLQRRLDRFGVMHVRVDHGAEQQHRRDEDGDEQDDHAREAPVGCTVVAEL